MKPVIAIHLATVLPAFLIGTWLIFFSEKGARWHRVLGALYLGLMLITAAVTFFVRELNHGELSKVHYVFIPLTVFGVFTALWSVRTRNFRRHRNAMIGLYVGVVAAGAFALPPGRLLIRTLMG